MKYIFTVLLLSIFNPVYLPGMVRNQDGPEEDNNWMVQVKEYKQELSRIRKNSEDIYLSLEVFELNIVEEGFVDFQASLSQTEAAVMELNGKEKSEQKNRFLDLYEKTLESYGSLMNLYDFYIQLQDKKEEWSNTYFNLWEQTYALKTQIDKMYIKEEKMNVHYGGMDNYEYQSVRKRNLYEACTEIYNTALINLKSTGDCDFYERILILEELIPILRKCEKLSYAQETRDLEKELKKEDDVQVMENLILNFKEE
jgi:hypothetical protein